MRYPKIRKFLVLLIFVLPAISYTGCKKQKKCGCGKDELFTMTQVAAYIYFNEDKTSITMQVVGNPYETYYFCNPSEMASKLSESKTGDILLVSGHSYWNCQYVYQTSNSYYQTAYKAYDLQVTQLELDLYGKAYKQNGGKPLDKPVE